MSTRSALLLAAALVASGCLPLRGAAERPGAAELRPPRPVAGSKAWRGRRPGYTIYTGFVPTSPRRPRPRDARCRLEVRHSRDAGDDLEVLGIISAEKIGPAIVRMRGGEDQALGWLRTKACRAGATVMFDVRTASEWFEYRGRLVRAIRGTARVALLRRQPPASAASPTPPPREPAPAAEPPPSQSPPAERPYPLWLE